MCETQSNPTYCDWVARKSDVPVVPCSYVTMRILGLSAKEEVCKHAQQWVSSCMAPCTALPCFAPYTCRIHLWDYKQLLAFLALDRCGLHSDLKPWRSHTHHILGQVLAGGTGVLLMGWHEPHTTRDLAAALCILVRHRPCPPWALLVPLQNGQSSSCRNVKHLQFSSGALIGAGALSCRKVPAGVQLKSKIFSFAHDVVCCPSTPPKGKGEKGMAAHS